MSLKTAAKAAASGLAKHSPGILTALGIFGFGTTCVMVAKAAPSASDVHAKESYERELASEHDISENEYKNVIVSSYKRESIELAKLYGPAAAVGITSVVCFIGANKIHMDRQAAIMAAYSLSAETLSKYQSKVIEKIGEDEHRILMSDVTKEIADEHQDPAYDYGKAVIPAGTVRVYDAVTGRYFYASRERILEAESEINRRLVNEAIVPLQEFYYAMGMEEHFSLGDVLGWDISKFSGSGLELFMGPHLDDEKNPCLSISYHVGVLSPRGA